MNSSLSLPNVVSEIGYNNRDVHSTWMRSIHEMNNLQRRKDARDRFFAGLSISQVFPLAVRRIRLCE
ncbi:hypothetical protein [Rhodopirellula europaea]|uniref:hypothetical protein n=1 Tax=Rhodopirellula europaea TaxID=1263866 RepID=UPI0011818F5D|nr:hypothetical protein [Rhodopirellula europaea]